MFKTSEFLWKWLVRTIGSFSLKILFNQCLHGKHFIANIGASCVVYIELLVQSRWSRVKIKGDPFKFAESVVIQF